jgi:hypothetical protein
MSPLETYVLALSKALHVGGEERDRILDEIRQHLDEAKLEFRAAGHSDEEAERLVIRRFGDPRDVCRNFATIYKSSPIRFIMNLFVQERTLMRVTIFRTLDWAIIVGIGLIAGLSAFGCSHFITPKLEAVVHFHSAPKAFVMIVFESVSDFLSTYWWALAILIAACVVVTKKWVQRDLFGPILKCGASAVSAGLVIWMFLGLGACIFGFHVASSDMVVIEYLNKVRHQQDKGAAEQPVADPAGQPSVPQAK